MQQQQQRHPQQKQAAAAAAAAQSAIDANTTYVFFLIFVDVAVDKQKQEKMPKARSNIYVGPGMPLKKKILYTYQVRIYSLLL